MIYSCSLMWDIKVITNIVLCVVVIFPIIDTFVKLFLNYYLVRHNKDFHWSSVYDSENKILSSVSVVDLGLLEQTWESRMMCMLWVLMMSQWWLMLSSIKTGESVSLSWRFGFVMLNPVKYVLKSFLQATNYNVDSRTECNKVLLN